MKYNWYRYHGKDIVVPTLNSEWDLEFVDGDRFGYRKARNGKHMVIHFADKDDVFELKEKDINRIIANSKGWSGKVKGKKVEAGEGGLDKEKINDRERYDLQIDSSNLKKAWLDKKNKELHVIFHNDAHWVYQDVTLAQAKRLEKAESQGSYFYYRIRNVKPQYKVSD
jgi:hypothetical protein